MLELMLNQLKAHFGVGFKLCHVFFSWPLAIHVLPLQLQRLLELWNFCRSSLLLATFPANVFLLR